MFALQVLLSSRIQMLEPRSGWCFPVGQEKLSMKEFNLIKFD